MEYIKLNTGVSTFVFHQNSTPHKLVATTILALSVLPSSVVSALADGTLLTSNSNEYNSYLSSLVDYQVNTSTTGFNIQSTSRGTLFAYTGNYQVSSDGDYVVISTLDEIAPSTIRLLNSHFEEINGSSITQPASTEDLVAALLNVSSPSGGSMAAIEPTLLSDTELQHPDFAGSTPIAILTRGLVMVEGFSLTGDKITLTDGTTLDLDQTVQVLIS